MTLVFETGNDFFGDAIIRGNVHIHQKDSGDTVPERWNFVPKAHRGEGEQDKHSEKCKVFHVAGARHLGKSVSFLEESWQVPG